MTRDGQNILPDHFENTFLTRLKKRKLLIFCIKNSSRYNCFRPNRVRRKKRKSKTKRPSLPYSYPVFNQNQGYYSKNQKENDFSVPRNLMNNESKLITRRFRIGSRFPVEKSFADNRRGEGGGIHSNYTI